MFCRRSQTSSSSCSKETSVAGYVAIRDLTKAGDIIRGATYSPFLPLIVVALIYLIMVVFFTWLVGRLEKEAAAAVTTDVLIKSR